MHEIIILILFLFVTCTWQACYSSCDTCSSYCSNCCLSCPSATLISNFTCSPLASVTEQIIVDDSWNFSKTPKMPFLIDSSGLTFTTAADLGWTGTSGLQLNLGTQPSIAFKFVNISTHYQIDARFSAELSIEPGCMNSYVGLYYSNNNISPDSYAYTYMFSMTQLA